MPVPWQILTGEFPPVPGGVSDYTALLAAGLALAGSDVHVWTTCVPGCSPETSTPAPGVTLHRFAPAWSQDAFGLLSQQLEAFAGPRRILVQYTPGSWGYRGVNFALGGWLLGRRRSGDQVWGMVHEPFYPWRLWDKPTRWLLAALHRQMMRQLLASCERVFLSIPGWEAYVAPFAPRAAPPRFEWLPIPSNIPVVANSVSSSRSPGCAIQLGSFGTYGPYITAPLRKLITQLLRTPDRRFVLLGRGGVKFARDLHTANPGFGDRLRATGDLPPAELSRALQSLDLLVQPYPDGASTRRTTLMAGLAHGLPIVTNTGHLSEPFWSDTTCVRTAPAGDVAGMAAACEALLASPAERQALGAAARRLYNEQFSLERTVERLLAAAR
jgi:glycosyltransferase involved in cell wall biosynthesis